MTRGREGQTNGAAASGDRFSGSSSYIASPELMRAVNMALFGERPLLLKGEPGTGKTVLAQIVADALGRELVRWTVRSTSKSTDGRYQFDAVGQLAEAHLAQMYQSTNPTRADAAVAKVQDPEQWIRKGALWRAFEADAPIVLLIDEIDKADIEFPNDLLEELDLARFHCLHLERDIIARHRPLVIITSNNEKELPPAFLRRCFFHYIAFPDTETMQQIVRVHHPNVHRDLLHQALQIFYQIRSWGELRKKPATSELIDWVRILQSDLFADLQRAHGHRWLDHLPGLEALLKDERDVELARRAQRRY